MITDQIIKPYLEDVGWIVTHSILTTKRVAGGTNYRGGVRSWRKIEREIRLLLPHFDLLTTLLDYYGFPDDAPGMQNRPASNAQARVAHVESQIAANIGDPRFIPHLVLHETEAWVFAAADHLGKLVENDPSLVSDLNNMTSIAGGPELINDDPSTAPSKRLQSRIPTYKKTLEGPLAIEALGLKGLRERCPHLDAWLTLLAR